MTPKPLRIPNAKFIPLFKPSRAPVLSTGEPAIIAADHKTVIYPNGTPQERLAWVIQVEGSEEYRATAYRIGEEYFEGATLVPPDLVVDPGHSRTRYYVYRGGRGGAKSHQLATAAVMRAMAEKITILCCREVQSSMADSVHKLIAEKIIALGLSDHFEVLVNAIRCKLTGSEFAFRGLRHNLQDIKSFEGAKICWVEEAVNVTEESWDVLDPTIRLDESEVWISYNTDLEDDYTYTNFTEDNFDVTLVEVSYLDNPLLSVSMLKQAEKMRRTNPKKYDHIWGGKARKAREGGVFLAEKVNIIDVAPAGMRMVRGWDFAGTEFDPKKPNKEPDWTVGARMGRTEAGRFVVDHVLRMRGMPHEVEETLVRTAGNDGHEVEQDLPQDPGQAGKHQVQYFVSKLAGHVVHFSTESGSKVTRAEPFASQVNAGNVDFVRGSWNDAVLKVLAGFDGTPGNWDDDVDAMGRAFRRLLEPKEMQMMKVMGL